MTVETPGRHVVAIQMLRAIAALMVVLVHVDTELTRLRIAPVGFSWLAAGVDIFFVISGFIMWTSVQRRAGMTAPTFLKNRIIRIVPLYWAVTTFVISVGLIRPSLLKTTVLDPKLIAGSYLFIPVRNPTVGRFWPIVVPGWSLNYEMAFYLIFAISLAIGRHSRIARLLTIAGLLAALFVVSGVTKNRFDTMNFYYTPALFEFLAGVLLGVLCNSGIIRPSYAYTAMCAVGFLLLSPYAQSNWGAPTMLAGATLVVAGAIFVPAIAENSLSKLGDASYSLYLTHAATLSALAWLWASLRLPLSWPVYALTSLIAAVVIAACVYRYFEVPVTLVLKTHFKRKQSPAQSGISPGGAAA